MFFRNIYIYITDMYTFISLQSLENELHIQELSNRFLEQHRWNGLHGATER